MKRVKALSLLAALLALVLLLASCGSTADSAKEVALKKILDKDAVYTPYKNPASATQVHALTDMSTGSTSAASLALFVDSSGTYNRYVVYDVATGNTVLDVSASALVSYSISLNSVSYDSENPAPYILVTKTTKESSSALATSKTVTELYNKVGTLLGEYDGYGSASKYADLLYFDYTFYKADATGTLVKYMDWSPMAMLPQPTLHVGEYYYEITGSDTVFTTYNSDLELLSTYRVPECAVNGVMYTVLGNGNILVQYGVRVPDSEEYDVFEEEECADVVTVIVDCENGKAKEIECSYILSDQEIVTGEMKELFGIKDSFCTNYFRASKIENKRITEESVLLFVEKDGDMKTVEFMGARVEILAVVGVDCWAVSLDDGRTYLVDDSADVIGEVTNAYMRGSYLTCDGKVFDMNLNEIFDYDEKDLTLKTMEDGNTLYFTNEDGDLLKWSGTGEPTEVVSVYGGEKSLSFYSWGYAVTDYDSNTTVLYSASGAQLITVDKTGASFSVVVSTDEAMLVKTTNADGDAVYYRLTK